MGVPLSNNESYDKSPAERLGKRLWAADWRQIQKGLWQRGRHRLYVDGIGIFLYRLLHGQWVRTHGLTYNHILTKDSIRFLDGYKLNILGD